MSRWLIAELKKEELPFNYNRALLDPSVIPDDIDYDDLPETLRESKIVYDMHRGKLIKDDPKFNELMKVLTPHFAFIVLEEEFVKPEDEVYPILEEKVLSDPYYAELFNKQKTDLLYTGQSRKLLESE